MACHLAGITTAVATCGTSFGVDHIKVLRPMLGDSASRDLSQLGNIVFTFDPDEAGQRAASRAFAEESRFASQTYVAVAPGGLDPCDLRLARGDAAVTRLIETKRPMFEFIIRRRLAAHDIETAEGRVAGLRDAAPVVAGIRDRTLATAYTRETAKWLGLDIPEVRRAVENARQRAGASTTDHRSGGTAPATHAGSGGEAVAVPDEPVAGLRLLPSDPITRMERDAVMAMVQQPGHVGAPLLGLAAAATFSAPMLSVVRDAVVANVDAIGAGDWLERLLQDVPGPFRGLVQELALAPIPARTDEDLAIYARSIVVALVERDLLARKASLLGQLQRADPNEQADRRAEIQRQLVDIDAQRMRLRADAEAAANS